MDALRLAIQVTKGGQAAVAAACGVTSQAVGQWRRVPPERVLDVARASGWQVTPHHLRPDLYPHAEDGLPAELRGGGDQRLGDLLGPIESVLRDVEIQRFAAAFGRADNSEMLREIEALEIPTNERARLLQAAATCRMENAAEAEAARERVA